jgi:hypothetical protein
LLTVWDQLVDRDDADLKYLRDRRRMIAQTMDRMSVLSRRQQRTAESTFQEYWKKRTHDYSKFFDPHKRNDH